MKSLRICLVLCLAGMTLGFNTGCASNITEEQELQIGRESHGEFEKEFGGKLNDKQIQEYVTSVGMSMVPYAERPKMDWQFTVLKSDVINAFAVPGGYIYITQGLLFKMKNEAELAGVLGHEIGHIAKKHSVQQIQEAQKAQVTATGVDILGQIFGVSGAGDLAGLVASLSLMKYGRGQEHEADIVGLSYMTRAGYNPRGMVQTMQLLKAEAGGKSPPEFLSTHPDPGNRVEYLTEEINDHYKKAAKDGKFNKGNFQEEVINRVRSAE